MSRVPSFLVGLAVSSVGYTYLSKELVWSRNKLMMTHFKAEGVEPYYPVRRVRKGGYTIPYSSVVLFLYRMQPLLSLLVEP